MVHRSNTVLVLAAVACFVGYMQVDTLNQGVLPPGNQPVVTAQKKEIEFPSLKERLVVFGIGAVAVGGMAALLNRKRLRADRLMEGSQDKI